MSQSKIGETDGHEVNEWTDRQGNLIGASVFLSPEELRQLQEYDTIEITLKK